LQTSTPARAKEPTEREDKIGSVAPFEPPLQRVKHSTACGGGAGLQFADAQAMQAPSRPVLSSIYALTLTNPGDNTYACDAGCFG